jgi:hypothetical protein
MHTGAELEFIHEGEGVGIRLEPAGDLDLEQPRYRIVHQGEGRSILAACLAFVAVVLAGEHRRILRIEKTAIDRIVGQQREHEQPIELVALVEQGIEVRDHRFAPSRRMMF